MKCSRVYHWTWKDPSGRYKNQIDFITINNRFRNAIKQTRAYAGADCGSDHNPVFATVSVKLKTLKRKTSEAKLQWNLLGENQELKDSYAVAVKKPLRRSGEGRGKLVGYSKKRQWLQPQIMYT